MNNEKINIKHKWGFGHAPLKPETALKNKEAVLAVLQHMKGEIQEIDLDALSLVKGLINRCIRKDQWDWFTVYTLLGRPDFSTMKPIVSLIPQYRNALKNNKKNEVEYLEDHLIRACLKTL